MELSRAKQIVTIQFEKFGLFHWKFRFSGAKRQFGVCCYKKLTIKISRLLTQNNTEEAFTDTLLHEIAHAIVGPGEGHNHVWQQKAIEIGCNGKRCYDTITVTQPKGMITLECPNCKKTVERYRTSKNMHTLACGKCCKQYNNGHYDKKYIMEVKR